jgi:cytochrome c oxidase cbb3-type subunit 3
MTRAFRSQLAAITTTTTTLLTVLSISASSCKREERSFHAPPAAAYADAGIPANNPVRPGPSTAPVSWLIMPAPLNPRIAGAPEAHEYLNNANAITNGQRMFKTFNCSGCHANGGGGMGPALIDEKWLYGSEPDQIYLTILQGRTGGMPSYRGRLGENDIWQLTAYVLSLSGQANRNAASGREDHMRVQLPPNSIDQAMPIRVAPPVTQPVTQTVRHPETQTVTQPVRQTATQTATSATQPATHPVTQPATKPVTQPATQPATQPSTHPSTRRAGGGA